MTTPNKIISTKILRPQQVCEMLNLSMSTLFRRLKEPDFPRKVRISSQAIGFIESEVIDWIESRKEVA